MSAALELYGAQTGNCLRVAVALEELGLPYQTHKLDLSRGQHKREPFLALNPDGRVPVLVDRSDPDDPLTIAQSNAILLHLCDLRPGILLPVDDMPARAIVLERFFYFVTDVIAANFSAFFLNRIGASAEAAGQLSARSIEGIASAERFLAGSRYMAGDTFSLADIVAVTIVNASRDKIDWERHHLLSRWFDDACQRPAVLGGMRAFY